MPTLTIEEVQTRLLQIIDELQPGDELIITRGDKPVARLLPPELPKGVPIYGRGKNMLVAYIDDDEHLTDFAEYMP
jgi:antitoxin (DNA-binding transcriptional repressor) of toxin-antitoxin stability system